MQNVNDYQFVVALFDPTNNELLASDNTAIQISTKYVQNKGGLTTVVVPDGHPFLDVVEPDMVMGVYLGAPGPYTNLPGAITPTTGVWYFGSQIYAQGLFRKTETVLDSDGVVYHTLQFTHMFSLIDRYVSAYRTGTSLKSVFTGITPATIMNTVVLYNMTANATTANGRLRDAVHLFGFTPSVAAPNPTAIDYTVQPGTQVGDVVRELATVGGISVTANFEFQPGLTVGSPSKLLLVRRGDTGSGGLRENRIYAMELDNLSRFSFTDGTLNERTVAVVGGAGAESDRTFHVELGENFSTPENDREVWTNAATMREDELPVAGRAAVRKNKARSFVNADISTPIPVLESIGMAIGTFVLGAVVRFIVGGRVFTKRISSIEVTFDQSQAPKLGFEFEELLEVLE